MSSAKPAVLLLSLSRSSTWEEDHPENVEKLSKNFSISHVRKIDDISETLAQRSPQAVIMTDPELAVPKDWNHAVCEELVIYVRNGGRAIVAGYWSSYVKPADANAWFAKIWGLPWQTGDYSRQTVDLNQQFSHSSSNARSLPASYSQKAVFLANVTSEDRLYWPSSEFDDEQQYRPVALNKIGEGYVGYIGDVNSEQGSQTALLAICDT